ncbi:MAG: hypothetical protein ACFCU3_08800 [Verrucomicrobiales bacterium]
MRSILAPSWQAGWGRLNGDGVLDIKFLSTGTSPVEEYSRLALVLDFKFLPTGTSPVEELRG